MLPENTKSCTDALDSGLTCTDALDSGLTECFPSPLDVAIIGLSGRFPKAENPEALWKNLCEGIEGVSFFSDEELLAAGIAPESLQQPNYVKANGNLDGIDAFDPEFFGFTPRDAVMLDPQHRLFLECAWEALETAGYAPGTYEGRIGVFAGCASSVYFQGRGKTNLALAQEVISTDRDFLPTRVSYKLNLRGPSVAVQTACSTSLVAVHFAWQSLLAGDCDIALAGAASIVYLKKEGYWYWEGGITSPDGHCRAFDAQAAGTVFGDGVGIVVLKRLSDALRDRDCIRAVIKGSAINNDGSRKVGFTAPSVEGQAAVITQAVAAAGISPETISYIETHGTGTALGDPVEIAALTKAYRLATQKNQFCAIGSVKTNIGHLNTAAGVTGLIKTVLALEHGVIPPTLHFTRPNCNIDFENSPFYVNAALKTWDGPRPRRAGVSSFGIGGTNAHVILEEAEFVPYAQYLEPGYVLPFSARTSSSLEKMQVRLAQHLRSRPDINLADVAYTLQTGREAFAHRRVLVCRRPDEAFNLLESGPSPALPTGYAAGQKSVVFMFPGQGTQYRNMARDLYLTEPIFREQVDLCAERLEEHLDCDIRDWLYDGAEPEERCLDDTWIAQPALFVTEYALARQWMAWGVQPSAMIGHSIGEFVAACLAGVLSLDDALGLVAVRGRLMQSVLRGCMLVVYQSEGEVSPLLSGLCIAAVNSPLSCVVSGPLDQTDSFAQRLTENNIEYRRLHTSHAFHSQMMEPILELFTAEVAKLQLRPPQIPYISNVTGDWITAEQCTDPEYWARHLRQAVLFSRGIERILERSGQILLEVGTGRSLAALIAQHGDSMRDNVVVSSLKDVAKVTEYEALLRALARMWVVGVDVNWHALHAGKQRRRVPLPTYPFERIRCWWSSSPSDNTPHFTSYNKETRTKQLESSNKARATKQTQSSRPVAVPQPASNGTAAAMTGKSASSATQKLIAGPVPLTPMQEWFFLQQFSRPHHWNMAVLLELQQESPASVLNAALIHLLRHHDALRLRFTRSGGHWQQVNSTRLHDVLTTMELPADASLELVQQKAAEIQGALNLTAGPLFRAVQFTFGKTRPAQLLMVCHHLVTDITSWRILIEDFATVCTQLLEGREAGLPAKTTSFQEWARQLLAHRSSPSLQIQAEAWQAMFAGKAFPQLAPARVWQSNTVESARTVAASLAAHETHTLTQMIARKSNARLSEVLLAAVAESLARWSNSRAVLIDVETHGRDPLLKGVDLSRTVGWFTSIFPVVLQCPADTCDGHLLEQVKQQLRRVDDGLGYGVLRYLKDASGNPPALATLPQAQISFNFLGQNDAQANPATLVRLQRMALGSELAAENHRPYLIEVNGRVEEGRLHVSYTYSRNVFRRADLVRLSTDCRNILRTMLVKERQTLPEEVVA
jgi:phthiocerol/phenolphthiocerol synthesis type-I polyketide synthase E